MLNIPSMGPDPFVGNMADGCVGRQQIDSVCHGFKKLRDRFKREMSSTLIVMNLILPKLPVCHWLKAAVMPEGLQLCGLGAALHSQCIVKQARWS